MVYTPRSKGEELSDKLCSVCDQALFNPLTVGAAYIRVFIFY